ncbi:hydantoinase B/oxoprolinase family protein [Niallia sp. 01092]|uniref:hydantoinase B/oxoprolinase family protein n=1 Tax=unclassified Niallia TaxID=2837522 RepID=UPI003FD3048D
MANLQNSTFNPVQVEIMWNRLITILEEQAKTLIRTSFTSILADSEDLSAGLFDSRGNMIAQANTGTPGHINSMALGVKHFLDKFPPESLHPGDVLIGNNAYEISGHLLDVTIVTPAFYKDKLIGYFASTCHVADIGGRGYTPEGESIFEEGLQIPYMKYYMEGKLNESLQTIISANVRAPYEVLGDLKAQVLGNEVGIKRLVEMLEEFQLEEIDTLGEEIMVRSEAGMRKAISEVPDGIYENEIITDGFDEPITLKCKVLVKGDEIVVDYDGSSPASTKGINVCLYYITAYTTYILKATIAPDIPNNEGSFRPVSVTAPEGSVVNAAPPMSTAARHVIGHFAPECVLGALYHAVPNRTIAEGASSIWSLPINGEDFSYVAFTAGGMGARPNKDGLSATAFPSGVRGVPVEIMETSAPIIFHEKQLRADSGGCGRYRGGLGQTIRFSVRTNKPWKFPSMFDRINQGAKGLDGGKSGAKAEVYINEEKSNKSKIVYKLNPDDIVTLKLPGGGGYGNPSDRAPQAVLQDVINGYVSKEQAWTEYGIQVKFGKDGWYVVEMESSK